MQSAAAVLALLALFPRPATPFAAPAGAILRCGTHGAGSARCASLRAHQSLRMQQGGRWSSPNGDNRHDLARNGDEDRQPGRPGGDGRVGGSEEIRMSPGARRMTPAERIDAMVSPMETGVVSNQVNAKGFSQKQVLQETISAGDDWWAGDTIDLQTDPNALPPDWVQEQSSGATYYRNAVTGVTTRTRPKIDALSSTAASAWSEQGSRQLDEGLLDLAFPASFESISEAELQAQSAKMEAEGAGLGGEENEEATRTLIRKIMQEQAEDESLAGGAARVEGMTSSARPTAGRELRERRDCAQSVWEEDEGQEKMVLGEEEALIKLVFTSEETRGRSQAPPPPPSRQEQTQVEASTETILRKIEAASLSGAADLAPIQGVDAEGGMIVQPASGGGPASAEPVRRAAGEVPEHLRPGNNAGQMNWAEAQLAQAQQLGRPLSDLPGFAANFLRNQQGGAQDGEGEEEYEAVPAWNPLPLIDAETGELKQSVGKRRVLKTAGDLSASSPSAAPPPAAAPPPQPRGGEQQMQDVLQVLFKDDLEMLDVRNAGTDGKSSSSLLEARARTGGLGALIDDVVEVDAEERAFTFVDEHQCIGCYNCAMIARNTFLMEDMHGRARVFNQKGDSDDVIQEAIESCPVDCIHGVTQVELRQLEVERETDVINNKSRLVGGSYTAEEKGGTPWLRLLARRAREGKGTFLGL